MNCQADLVHVVEGGDACGVQQAVERCCEILPNYASSGFRTSTQVHLIHVMEGGDARGVQQAAQRSRYDGARIRVVQHHADCRHLLVQ